MASEPVQSRSTHETLARARLVRSVAVAISIAAFLGLAISFGMHWKPYIQFPAGLVCYLAIEWQRRASRKLADAQKAAIEQSVSNAYSNGSNAASA